MTFLWEKVLIVFLLLLPTQLGRHFWLKNSYIFGLKVDYLSPTVYLQDLLILFLIFFKRKEIVSFVKLHIKLLVACYLLLITNIYFSFNPLVSFFAWVRVTEITLLGILVCKNAKKTLSLLVRLIPWIIIFEFVLGVSQVVKESSVGGIFWLFGERTFNVLTPGIARGTWLGRVFLRPYGTFSHPNSMSGFILVCLVLLFSKAKFSLLDKLGAVLGLVLIILGFSRVIWLTLFILCLVYLVSHLIYKRLHNRLNLGFRYLTVVLPLPFIFYLFSRTEIESQSYLMRRRLAEFAVNSVKRSPLFGVGLNNFVISLSQKSTAWQWFYWLQPVHNIFLLVASETGLVGLVVFVTFLSLVVKNLFGQMSSSGLYLLVSIFCILFTGMFDHYWLTLIQNQLLFILVLGLSWGLENAKITP